MLKILLNLCLIVSGATGITSLHAKYYDKTDAIKIAALGRSLSELKEAHKADSINNLLAQSVLMQSCIQVDSTREMIKSVLTIDSVVMSEAEKARAIVCICDTPKIWRTVHERQINEYIKKNKYTILQK
jgi:hypothetical protein